MSIDNNRKHGLNYSFSRTTRDNICMCTQNYESETGLEVKVLGGDLCSTDNFGRDRTEADLGEGPGGPVPSPPLLGKIVIYFLK